MKRERGNNMKSMRVGPWENKTRVLWAVLLTVTMLAAACAGTEETADGSNSAESDDETVTDAASPEEVEATEEGSDDATASTEPPDLTGLRMITTNALGGMRLGVDPEIAVLHEGELVEIRPADGGGRVIISRVSVSGNGAGVATIDDLLESAKNFGPVDGAATGQTMTLLGQELEQYKFRGEPGVGNPRLFPSSFRGMASNMGWAPLPFADLYIGTLEGGVLVAGVVADDEAALPALHELLEAVVPTISLTAAAASPVPTEAPGSLTPLGAPDPVEPRQVDDALADLFVPIQPGSYDLANLSQPTEVDVPDGWCVAPNFPGFVVLSDLTVGQGAGPGDHDVVFLQGTTGLHVLDPLRQDLVEGIPVQDPAHLEAFLSNPPDGLIVSDVDSEAVLGGRTVTRFDLQVDAEATCQTDSPCAFAFVPATVDFVKFIGSGYINRFWWVSDAPNGGLLIGATAPASSDDWLDDRVAGLLGTLTFE